MSACAPFEVTQTIKTAATSWQINVYVSFPLNTSSHSAVLGSHDESNMEVLRGRPTRRLRGLGGDGAPRWLPSIQ